MQMQTQFFSLDTLLPTMPQNVCEANFGVRIIILGEQVSTGVGDVNKNE